MKLTVKNGFVLFLALFTGHIVYSLIFEGFDSVKFIVGVFTILTAYIIGREKNTSNIK